MKTKLLPLLLVFPLLLFLAGCGEKETATAPGADTRVAAAYTEAIAAYEEKTALDGFWDISAGYAVLDEKIQSKSYDLSGEEENQRGAIILALIMMGENPYNDNGTNRVTALLERGVSGQFAIPVLNFLGLQAAAADLDEETVAGYIDYCCTQLSELSAGPDIGGWAAVALARYVDDPVYGEKIKTAMDSYVSALSENLAAGTMGSEGITYGCVVTGLTALTNAGLKGYDVTKDSPWIDSDPIAVMYENLTNGEENVSDYYQSQYYLEFADLYKVLYEEGSMAWLRCGVSGEKLTALIEEAEALDSSDAELKAALDGAKAIPQEEVAAAVPSWGSTYYALYDAVKALQ